MNMNGNMVNQSLRVRETVPKKGLKNGTYTVIKTRKRELPTAHCIHLFEKTPIEKIL
jgi:hypothetical protein